MKRSRKGGLTKANAKVYNSNMNSNNIYRVISIHNKTKHITIIGVYDCIKAATLMANDIASKEVKCYVHGDGNRVLHIAGE
jgi:hypothetical protein